MIDRPTPTLDPLPPELLSPPSPKGDGRGLTVALAVAAVLHLVVLVVFDIWPTPHPRQPLPDSALEVLLVQAPENTDRVSPDAPGALHNRQGETIHGDAAHTLEGETDTPPATGAPLALAPSEQPPGLATTSTPPTGSPLTALTLEGDAPRRPEVQATPQPPVVDAAQILASRDHTVARLAAAPSPGEDDSSSNLRRRAVSASTREIRYASYLAAWTRKVERIGNINYPQAAKEQRIYGSLLLHVSIRADGSLAQVRVVRSSGYDLLDQAAVRIVELAAPFAPFPPDIAAETDVLDIIRNWQFMRGDTLGWEH
ncbi:TonB family protein [Marichromatium bheemlicum]|uniref:TonB family protein n=1 Tax=Marichromatium bheemlicum TaxID=365339 RepID=UPI001B2FE984|nr:energy transducer TonB [Marichromatium bheemlicum]